MIARGSFTPLRGRWWRALVEGVIGETILLVLAAVIALPGHALENLAVVTLVPLSWIWLLVWPALRLRRYRPEIAPGIVRWSWRQSVRFVRILSLGIGLAAVAHFTTYLVPSGGVDAFSAGRGRHGLALSIVAVVLFLVYRVAILIAARIRRRIRRRLRWQLMISHVLVIILTLTTIAAAASVAGIFLFLFGTNPDSAAMARTVAEDLRVARQTAPFQRSAIDSIFRQVEEGKLPTNGQPPLAGIISSQLVPSRILLLDLNGRVLAGTREAGTVLNARQGIQNNRFGPPPQASGNGSGAHVVTGRTWQAIYGNAALWSRIRAAATESRSASFDLPNRYTASQYTIGIAPVLDGSNRLIALVAVQVQRFAVLNNQQDLQAAVGIFGASTIILIVATAIPVLVISFLFSYLVARGLTRRVESVSRVATAIVTGDLSQRAPVTASNEIGRLAEDVNYMAGHLQETMGELEAARSRAIEALRTRQELVANISHELRTPLAIIRSHLENVALRRPAAAGAASLPTDADIPVPPSTMHALNSETERLAALIDDLFALSRVQAGGLPIRCQPIDVAQIVDEVVAVMRPLAWQEGAVALSVEATPGLPYALADADRVRQILSNLVRNAVRHTPDGGIIILKVEAEEKWIVLSVADTGEGIAAEHLPHIFERFYRVDEARSREAGGAGLGLAIVRELVELMGGKVTVESERGEGSVFKVFLPQSPS